MYFNFNNRELIGQKLLRLILAAVILGIYTGCSELDAIIKYSEARQVFNEAAKLENGIKLRRVFQDPQVNADNSSDPVPITPDIIKANNLKSIYQESLALLQSIDLSNEAELEKQGMLMDKLTLEALCLLRLKRFDEIEPVINRAIKLSEEQNSNAGSSRSRDSYLMQALPGLIMNDQAYAKIPQNINSNTSLFDEIEKMLVGPGDHALKYLSPARKAAEKNNHPVKLYLIQAELAAYRNLMGAYTYCKPTRPNKPDQWSQSEEQKKVAPLLKCLEEMDQTPNNAVFELWRTSFGRPILDHNVKCQSE